MLGDQLERFHGKNGEPDSKRPAHHRQKQALRQNLAQKAHAAHAHRDPHCIFLLPLQSPYQQQSCRVSTRNQQHQPRRAQQQHELLRFLVRRRREQHTLNQAENRGRRSSPQRQRQRRDHREGRALP